jgi:hypothetical protein
MAKASLITTEWLNESLRIRHDGNCLYRVDAAKSDRNAANYTSTATDLADAREVLLET